jgi:hypothetical protein
LKNTSPNPNAHTAGETIRGALTPKEAERFERHIRPSPTPSRGEAIVKGVQVVLAGSPSAGTLPEAQAVQERVQVVLEDLQPLALTARDRRAWVGDYGTVTLVALVPA